MIHYGIFLFLILYFLSVQTGPRYVDCIPLSVSNLLLVVIHVDEMLCYRQWGD